MKSAAGAELGDGTGHTVSQTDDGDGAPAIHVSGLYKSFGSSSVLEGVNLDIMKGEFYALMGPNGSGKSTLSAIIASVIPYDRGTVEVCGRPPSGARKSIGYVPQDNFSIPMLSGRENLSYFAGILGYSRTDSQALANQLLARMGLTEDANKLASRYSGGMRKRLEVATALFPGIKVMILDEPTTGLDPGARREFYQLVKGAVQQGTSILLITHLGADAELADRVGLIYNGRIVAEGSPASLKRKYATLDVITVETGVRGPSVVQLLEEYSKDGKVAETQNGYHLYAHDGAVVVPEVIHALDRAGIHEKRIEVSTATLEDVFFGVTKHSMREMNLT